MPRAAVFPYGSASGGIVIDFETLDELKERAAQHMGINVGSVFDDSGAIIKHQKGLNRTLTRASSVDSFAKASTAGTLSRASSVDSLTSSDLKTSMRAEVFLHGSASGGVVIGFDTLDQLKEGAGQHMGITVGSAFDDCGAIIEDVRHLVQLLETHEETIVGLRKNNGIHFATAVCRKNSNCHETKQSCFSDAASTVDTLDTSSCSRSSPVDSTSSDDGFMALDEELREICASVIKAPTFRSMMPREPNQVTTTPCLQRLYTSHLK